MLHFFSSLLILSSFLLSGPAIADNDILRMATTTSTENSGLLRELLPPFEKATNTKIHVIAVGTGKALAMGRKGDVDLVLVHARTAENKFVEDGNGRERFDVMHNDFVVVGPKSDPAGVAKMREAALSFKKIADSKSPFVSRGDDSGTHKKEITIWKNTTIQPAGRWYREVGQGMGKALQIAGEMDAYILVDRGTWLAFRKNSPLVLLVEGGGGMQNPYGIIAVNPERYADVNYASAQRFIDWLIAPDQGQKIINDYRINGEQLFYPTKK